MLRLHKDWKLYYNLIKERCRNLIIHSIWSGIDQNKFDAWLNNFKTEEEKYFSACALDALIYRSNEQTYSLMYDLLTLRINNIFRELPPSIKIDKDILTLLKDKWRDPQIRLVCAVKSNDPSTESAYGISRFMKYQLSISEKWIIKPWEITESLEKGIKTFIFIDDFMGTGDQICEILEKEQIGEIIKNNYVIFAPLVAHENGITQLKDKYPNINVCYSELINNCDSFFDTFFNDEDNTIADAKRFYINMMKKRNIKYKKEEEYFGYGGLSLTYFFEHACPNSSLPIFYYENELWKPLFKRA